MIRPLIVGGASKAAKAFRQLAAERAIPTCVLTRREISALPGETHVRVSDYFSVPDEVLMGVTCVLNFVGAPGGLAEDALRRLNATGPVELAAQARAAGVSWFVQLSSLSIFGDAEDIEEDSPTRAESLYGQTKLAAEEGLSRLADDGFGVLLVRAPLIYGPDGGGKLSQLIRLWLTIRWLPAPRRLEPRSMVHVRNLASGILTALEANVAGPLFVCDPESFDLERLAAAIRSEERPAALIRLPSAAFAPLEKLAPGLYRSLYGRSVVGPGSRAPLGPEAINIDEALRSLVRAHRRGN